MTVHIFAGSTLSPHEIRQILPDAIVHPPVQHLDVLRLDTRPGDQVAIIDGVFFQVASVRHKELMWLLHQGVAVAGSSSMGALRAAELAPYGMRGVGQVFEAYRSGRIDGDDEVAIAHAEADEGWRPLSDPMINIRTAIDRAVAAEVIGSVEGHAIVEAGRRTFFPQRRLSRIIRQSVREGVLPADSADRMIEWASINNWDAKKEDATLLLNLLADRDRAVRAIDGDDLPITGFTPFVVQWLNQARVTTMDGVPVSDQQTRHVLQLFAEDTVAWIEAWGLAVLAGHARQAWSPEHQDTIRRQALDVCQQRGLIGEHGLSVECQRTYLDVTEFAQLTQPGRQLLAAARIAAADRIHSIPLPPTTAPQRAAAAALTFNAKLATQGEKFRPSHIAASTIDREFTRWWPHENLEVQARRHGFSDIADFRSAARIFLPHALSKGVPANLSWDDTAPTSA